MVSSPVCARPLGIFLLIKHFIVQCSLTKRHIKRPIANQRKKLQSTLFHFLFPFTYFLFSNWKLQN